MWVSSTESVHYRCITDEPEHATPVQDSSQGSLPFHPFSTAGLFKALYRSCRAVTAHINVYKKTYSLVAETRIVSYTKTSSISVIRDR